MFERVDPHNVLQTLWEDFKKMGRKMQTAAPDALSVALTNRPSV
jgi:hypothetical protein